MVCKPIYVIFLFLAVLCCLPSVVCRLPSGIGHSFLYADTLVYWEPEQRLTYDSIPQLHCQVWAYDSLVHILVNYDIPAMYLRSTDYGQSWSDTTRLNIESSTNFQTLNQQDTMVYFTWSENRDGPPYFAQVDTKYVFFRKSNDYGATLDSAIFLGKGAPVSIDAEVDSIFIAPVVGDPPPIIGSYLVSSYNGGSYWFDYLPIIDSSGTPNILYRNGILHFGALENFRILYTRSTDLGTTWSPPTSITAPTTVLPKRPVLAVGPDGYVYIAWTDNKYSGMMQFDDVLFRTSTDDGLTWGSEERLTPDSRCDAGGALDMVSQDSMIFIAWDYNGVGYPAPCSLFFLASTDCGETWRQREGVAGGEGYALNDANVAVSQDYVYVVWRDPHHLIGEPPELYIRRGRIALQPAVAERIRASIFTVHVCPNPFIAEIRVQIADGQDEEITNIRMFDVLGKEVFNRVKDEPEKGRIGEVVTVDTKKLPCGVYFVEIKAGSSLIVKKIIKIQ